MKATWIFRSVVPLLSALGLIVGTASAQQAVIPGTFEFAPQGGVSIPTGDFGDIVGTGYNAGGQLGFYADPRIAVGFGVLYNHFDVSAAVPDSVVTGSAEIWEVTVFGKFLLLRTSKLKPYARVSAGGFYNEGIVNLGGPGNSRVQGSSTRFGAGGGLGVQYRFPRSVGIFAEGMGMVDFTEGDDTVYWVVRGGLNIYFSWSHP